MCLGERALCYYYLLYKKIRTYTILLWIAFLALEISWGEKNYEVLEPERALEMTQSNLFVS